MDTNSNRTEADAIIEQTVAAGVVQTIYSEKILAVPHGTHGGRKLESIRPLLDGYRTRPEKRAGVQRVDDLASFIAWTTRHKDNNSALFCEADREAPRLVAAIDYHEAGAATWSSITDLPGLSQDGKARHVAFGAVHPMALDERWKAWREVDGEAMSQADFAAFLEDHALDLCPFAPSVAAATDTLQPLPPDVQNFLNMTGGQCGTPEQVIALAAGLDVAVGQKVANAVKLQSGEGRIVFEQSNTTTQNGVAVTVPAVFLIAVPVFALSTTVYRLPVRLRYRATPGGVLWIPTLWRADETLDQAIRDAAEKARTDTSLPLFYGASPFKGGQ
jgi:hypothetical protein